MSLTLHLLSARKSQGQRPRQAGSGARLPLVTGGPAYLPVPPLVYLMLCLMHTQEEEREEEKEEEEEEQEPCTSPA
ncbi:hypothetical protein O3P69_002322 [Scylla paramamosain]|uniref:Uncharacterized protein n=1 Tax=Scylla paramamosain TaxID=85552 RepID=A0AAW0V5S7_SCYPA